MKLNLKVAIEVTTSGATVTKAELLGATISAVESVLDDVLEDSIVDEVAEMVDDEVTISVESVQVTS